MSENNQLTFAAIIRISLPDAPETVTAHVTLTADDTIAGEDGRFIPLHACTIADLQAYADALESEIWQTYQTIKLTDLADDEAATVDLMITDASGNPITPSREWFKKAVVVPKILEAKENRERDEAESNEPPPFVAEIEEIPPMVPEEVNLAAQSIAEEPTPDSTDQETAVSPTTAEIDSDPAPDLEVLEQAEESNQTEHKKSETADTHIAIEPDDEAHTLTPLITVAEPESVFDELETDTYRDPWIAPSQARVRVAGRRLPNGHPTWAAVDILIDETALRSAQAHALTSLDREVAGVLIGPRPEKQPDGRYVVHVIDTIIAKYTVMHGASVTYTPESWRYMSDKLHERYPDETAVIVGWYHTHPGFGIFLSGMDQFIHQNFFTQIWHIAYVLDPRARTSGFFSWDRQKTRVSPFEFQWPSWAARSW